MIKLVIDIRIFSVDIINHTNSCARNVPTDNPKSQINPNSSLYINLSKFLNKMRNL